MSRSFWRMHIAYLAERELPEVRADRERAKSGAPYARTDHCAAIAAGVTRLLAHRAVRENLNDLHVGVAEPVRLILGVPRHTADAEADAATMDALVHALWRDEPVPS